MAHAHIYVTFYTSEDGSSSVVGESTAEFYEGTIMAESWQWDVGSKKATGADAGAEPSVLELTKSLDASTTQLLGLMSGDEPKIFPTVRIDMLEESLKHDVNGSRFGLSVTLSQVQIIDYKLGASNEDGLARYQETWTLDYRMVTLQYWPDYMASTDDEGNSQPAPATVTVLSRSVDAPVDKPSTKDKDKDKDKDKEQGGSGGSGTADKVGSAGRNLPPGTDWKDTRLDWTDKSRELDSEGLARRRSGGGH